MGVRVSVHRVLDRVIFQGEGVIRSVYLRVSQLNLVCRGWESTCDVLARGPALRAPAW